VCRRPVPVGLAMRRARGRRGLLLLLGVALSAAALLRGCAGQQGEDGSDAPAAAAAETAPMEEKERRALYAAIESFVGKGWNGSGLYPDPCGWSPIQARPCPSCAFPFASIYVTVLFDFLARVCSFIMFVLQTREAFLFGFFGFARPRHTPFLGAPLLPALSSNPKTVCERKEEQVGSLRNEIGALFGDAGRTPSRHQISCCNFPC
jgi:hypothetical protein